MLRSYYNVHKWQHKKRTNKKSGKAFTSYRLEVMGNCKYARHYRKFHTAPRTHRGYCPEEFTGSVYSFSTYTSSTDGRGNTKPLEAQYSAVDDLLERIAG